jgi:hypothetical protein
MSDDKLTKPRSALLQEAISFYSLDPRRWSEELTYLDAVRAESSDMSPSLDDQRRLYRLAIETYGLKESYFSHITGEQGDEAIVPFVASDDALGDGSADAVSSAPLRVARS